MNIVYSGQWIQGARQRYRCRSRSSCTLFYFTANTIQVDNKRKQFGEIKESKDTKKKKKRNQKVKNALEGLDASDVGS